MNRHRTTTNHQPGTKFLHYCLCHSIIDHVFHKHRNYVSNIPKIRFMSRLCATKFAPVRDRIVTAAQTVRWCKIYVHVHYRSRIPGTGNRTNHDRNVRSKHSDLELENTRKSVCSHVTLDDVIRRDNINQPALPRINNPR